MNDPTREATSETSAAAAAAVMVMVATSTTGATARGCARMESVTKTKRWNARRRALADDE